MRRPAAIFAVVSILSATFVSATFSGGGTPQKPAELTKENVEFFETNIRPVLVDRCYECHSSQAKKVRGKLLLDTQKDLAKGGANGVVIVPGDIEKSPLIHAIRWTDPDFAMPPKAKLTPQQVEKFEQWVKMGAPDPRTDAATTKTAKTRDLEADRNWWAFRPVVQLESPTVKQQSWAKKPIDLFILKELEAKALSPSPKADPRTLIERAYLDLTGLRPSYEQVEEFAKDPSEKAYAEVVEKLLASPQYGQRFGRYWLDIARYGEDNPTSEATNRPYPNAWRYRDWVIDAFNRDVPYNQFVSLQIAGDLIPQTARKDMIATGFLGTGPIYHKDGRLSKDVIENLYMDDWDERVDVVSRGVLGLTVACARCHDHKFDPISTRDYYAMASVFASTLAGPRPLTDVDPEVETRFMTAAQRLFYFSYVANLMRGEPGTSPKDARIRVENYVGQLEKIEADIADIRLKYPALYAQLAKLDRRPAPYPASGGTSKKAANTPETPPDGPPTGKEVDAPPATKEATAPPLVKETVKDAVALPEEKLPGAKETDVPQTAKQPDVPAVPKKGLGKQKGGGAKGNADPYFHSVFDAGLWVDGSDSELTLIDIKPGVPRDLHVLPGGNVTKPGEVSPRGFITVLSKGDPGFHNGSGRLELTEKMFTDAAPLAARVIVNRVWGWHFGRPLVETPSDFGAQGEKPSNPKLLDDLAARFIANGWSIKWLNREIMLSATYQQASRTRADAAKVDPDNKLLWRMNPRRLDVEAYRDCILQATGTLDATLGGPSSDIDQVGNKRRSVYARISRGRVSNLLQLYDFPEPTMHSPGRETTTTPLQQLFVLNSPFMRAQAVALVDSVSKEADDVAKVRAMYHQTLLRDPTAHELEIAVRYLATGTITDYAHALLSTNEEIFWP